MYNVGDKWRYTLFVIQSVVSFNRNHEAPAFSERTRKIKIVSGVFVCSMGAGTANVCSQLLDLVGSRLSFF